MLQALIGVFIISSGALCAPSDAVEVGVCNGDGCTALKSTVGAVEKARRELGCCTHADCPPSVTTILCAHDVVTHFFQNASTSKVCSDFNKQCEALRVVKMNLQLSTNILGCSEREERAFISPSASTRKVLEDLLPQTVVSAIHDVLPDALKVAKVQHAVGSTRAINTGIALVGGLSDHKGNVYFFDPAPALGGTNLGWGAVCADGFTRVDADVVCRQAGYARAKVHYGLNAITGTIRGDTFGSVPIPTFQIILGGALNCLPANPNIQLCPGYLLALTPPSPPCPSGQVAAVECEEHLHV